MKHSRKRSLGAPALPGGKFMGVPTPLLVLGLVAAAGLAYANSGDGTASTTTTTNADPTKVGGTTPTSSGSNSGLPPRKVPATSSSSSSAGTAAAKPKRRPIVMGASPLLYVFVNSMGGEGIFDKLRNSAGMIDGNGLGRITTLSNHEFAGWATGNEWTAPDTKAVYIQLYQVVGNVGYNYWIQKSETVQMHAQSAQQGYSWTDYTRMSDGTMSNIATYYFDHYTL